MNEKCPCCGKIRTRPKRQLGVLDSYVILLFTSANHVRYAYKDYLEKYGKLSLYSFRASVQRLYDDNKIERIKHGVYILR